MRLCHKGQGVFTEYDISASLILVGVVVPE